ncbi:MAG: histidine kinase, partial [Treponema sp.]|nr:histidine kinase [Treponema sp.]
MKLIKALIYRYIFSDELPLDARIMNMVCAFGLAAVIAATAARIIEKANPNAMLAMFAIFLCIIALFMVSNRYNLHKIGTYITLIVLGNILFPVLYFSNGGVNGGMAAYFVLSIVIIFLLSTGKICAIILTSHIIVILTCYFVGNRYPHLIQPITTFQIYVDNIQSLLVSGFFIGFVIKYQILIYRMEKQKVEDAGKALARQDQLLH